MLSVLGTNFVHGADVWLYTFVLAILFPFVDASVYAHLKSTMALYVWCVGAEWALVFVAFLILANHGLALGSFGQNFGTYPRTAVVTALLFLLVAGLLLQSKRKKSKRKSPPSPERIAKAVEGARKLVPKNRKERIAFLAVALTAGFCEEFLYRGWLLGLAGSALKSIWLGLLISSVFFGVAHLYQGRGGVIKTGIAGLVFGLIYIASGSLLPGQILHALLDLNNGLTVSKILSRAEAAAAA
jgi:uncharacterized protein